MKIAIRDDDINYFYKSKDIINNYKDIDDNVTITLCVIPYVKGNWIENTKILEEIGPLSLPNSITKKIRSDNKIYEIDKNLELIDYLKSEKSKKKYSIAIHGINHRNEEENIKDIKTNFIIGAEFYTKKDLKIELLEAINYLESVFQNRIKVFTPPQNMLSSKGAMAIFENDLMCCSNLPGIKDVKTFIQLFGISNYLKYLKYRKECYSENIKMSYPEVMKYNKNIIVDHNPLQPNTNLKDYLKIIDNIRKRNGIFILSTHSYAFDYKLKNEKHRTLKHNFMEVLEYIDKIDEKKYMSLNKIFENEN